MRRICDMRQLEKVDLFRKNENGIYRANSFTDADGNSISGMGIHSGRSNNPSSATNGCIRTTDEAMATLVQLTAIGLSFNSITVQD